MEDRSAGRQTTPPPQHQPPPPYVLIFSHHGLELAHELRVVGVAPGPLFRVVFGQARPLPRRQHGASVPVFVPRQVVLPHQHPQPVAVVVVAPVLDFGVFANQVVARRLEILHVVHLWACVRVDYWLAVAVSSWKEKKSFVQNRKPSANLTTVKHPMEHGTTTTAVLPSLITAAPTKHHPITHT